MKKMFFAFCLLAGFVTVSHAQQPPSQDSVLKQYVGKYTFPSGSVISETNVNLSDGNLSMSSSAGESPLEKTGEDTYSIPRFQGTAKFNRDSNGKVIGVSIVAMGYTLEGTKTEGGSAYVDKLKNKSATTKPFIILQVR